MSTYNYQPFKYVEQITSSIIIFFVIFLLSLIYFVKIRKKNVKEPLTGYVLIINIYVEFIRNILLQILGKKFEKLTPYFLFLFTYILFANIISVFNFESPTSSLTITLSLAFITFFGIFAIGFKFQKLSYLKKFTFNLSIKKKSIPIMINPLNIISSFAPLVSLSFRLWGNIFAGSLIISMLLYATDITTSNISFLSTFNIFGGIILIPLNLYFDLISGFIQTFVFTLLTMVYWKLESKT